jgi:photosystem II stability/assembly factor-like uncharacterized protein
MKIKRGHRTTAAWLLGILLLSTSFSGASAQSALTRNAAYKLLLPLVNLNRPPVWLGPEGGLISAVVVDPRNPSNVYAASWGGGVYKSTDGGLSWTWKSQGLQNLTVVSLAIDPDSPSTLFAGTYRGKLFKSTDGGDSWFLSSTGVQESAIVYSIAVDPRRPQTVYMSTRGISNELTPPWRGVIYRSDDGGSSWTAKLDDLAGESVQDWAYALAIHPFSTNVVFAATHEQGILYSRDWGETWRPANEGITNFSTRAVVFGPSEEFAETAYTAVWEKRGVFKSEDLGNSWTIKDNGIPEAQIYVMDIDPFHPRTLFLATFNQGVMKTTNGGNRWIPAGLQSVPIATVRFHPLENWGVFAGTVGDGLYLSRDGGANWARSQSGLKASSVTSLSISPFDPQVYFASTSGRGVLRSADGGKSWEEFNQNLGSRWINALVEQSGGKILFALTSDAGLYRCDLSNPGGCWQSVGGIGTAAARGQPGVTRHFSSESTFFAASEATGVASSQVWPSGPGWLALAFAPTNSSIGYLAGTGSGVYRTEDGGITWNQVGLPGRTVWSLAVDPQYPQRVYAAVDQAGTVRVSEDAGQSWADASLPGVTGYALAFSPGSQGSLFAGTGSGVYRLANGGWQPAGLAGTTIASLAFHPVRPGWLFAGAVGGAFISKDGGSTWSAGPQDLAGHTVQSLYASSLIPDNMFYCTTAHGLIKEELERYP